MRQSRLFSKTRREDPKDENALNAKLLLRAGFVHKEMAGAYSFLPLGLMTLNNINRIIREELDNIGSVELQMTALQDPAIWEKTERFSDEVVDIWFKTKLKNDSVLGLGFTHEEPITRLMSEHISSYRDLPVFAYQIQNKFRNETRSKSGILRGREFLMNDLYSFTRDEAELDVFYQKVKEAYEKIFTRLGLMEKTHFTFASGGVFSKYSHEFQTESEFGEDIVYISDDKKIAINKEVLTDEVLTDLGLDKKELREAKTIEIGNIFKLGTRFSESLGLFFLDETGKKQPVVMGSYGLGSNRLMGTMVEILSDEGGLVWPTEVAPFAIHLLSLGDQPEVVAEADEVYQSLSKVGFKVLYDDRPLSAGEKLADADLLGMPIRLVISPKTLSEDVVEVKPRFSSQAEKKTKAELKDYLMSVIGK